MSNDKQQICPHCGKLIEPGYYAYDKPVNTQWLNQALNQALNEAAQNVSKAIAEAFQSLAKPPRWIEVPEPLTNEQRKELIKERFTKPPMLTYPEGHIIPITQILTDEELEIFKAMSAEEKPPADITGHVYAEPDPSYRTIAHMAQYMAPTMLDWVRSLGIDEHTPLEWNISNEVLRAYAQEAEHPGYKCFKPGKHMTLSVTHAGTIHIQHFVRAEDNTWRVDTRY